MRNGLPAAARLTLVCALGALFLAPAAAADIRVGVADDHPKGSPEVAARFYDEMKDVGLTENRITLLWDSAHPTTIDGQDNLTAAIHDAQADGVRITLDIYPTRAKALTDSPVAPGKFAAFAALVARTFPTVKDFIIGNEPNKSRFWQPQFNRNGTRAACSGYEPVLAASYDALKSVDRSITVVGVGLGPRGTDNPLAPGNLSISPVRCLADVGRAYRRSKRTKPIMDALSYHPYPNASTDKIDTGYAWPNAGIPDLARIKQAVWDAFHGTGQPTFQEAGMPNGPARTLKLRLNEVGWQVSIPPANRSAYFGKESVVTTDEGTQAAIYGNLIPLLACDPSVESVLFFNLVDEANLDRWQSGLMRADWTRRPSYGIVKGAIAAGQTRCAGRVVAWRHDYRPVGVHLNFLGRLASPLRSEQVLELRGRLRGGHALHRRPLPRPAAREGGADPPGADLAVAADGSHAGRCAQIAREARRRLGQGDPVPAEAAEAGVLRVWRDGRGRDERCSEGDVRRPPVRGW